MNPKTIYLYCLLCLLFLGITACAETVKKTQKDDSPTSAVDFLNDSDGEANDSGKSTETTLQFTEIEGMWISPCVTATNKFSQDHFEINKGKFNQETKFHLDSDCISNSASSSIISGTYEIGKDITTNSGLNSKEIDFILVNDDTTTQRILDIIYTENINSLYLGTPNDKNSRPSTLDFAYPYTK